MELKNFFAQDDAGNILSAATCYLYVRGTESLVEGLQGANGVALNNPFMSDQQGLVQFAVPNGIYDLRVVKDSRDHRIQVQCNDVTETAALAENAARAVEEKLKDPAQGPRMLGTSTPSGADSTVDAEIKAIDKEHHRPAWSALMGNLQHGPLIVDAVRYLKITGDIADKEYNNAAFQNMLAGLPSGAEIELPSRGLAYLDGDLDVTSTGANIRGKNSGAAYDQFIMKFMNAAVPAFNAKRVGLAMSNFLMHAAFVGRAMNATQDAINFDVAADNGHADARIDNVGFLYFRNSGSAIYSAARNIRYHNCVFSNGRRVFSMEYAVIGPEDQRVFEFVKCKYHSMGRLLSAEDSLFYFNPLSQALSLMVEGGHADDTVRIMRGFVGMSHIHGLSSTRAAGAYADLDATGYDQAGYEQFYISDCKLMNINAVDHEFSGLKSKGKIALEVDGLSIACAGGHGVEILSNNAKIKNVTVQNASMGETGIYSGFYIGPDAANTIFVAGNLYQQGRLPQASTMAKFAVENLGTDTVFQQMLYVDGLAGNKAYYLDPVKSSHGHDPAGMSGLLRVSQGGPTPPATGKYKLGDQWETIGSSGYTRLWSCINPNPLTWVPIAPS